MDACRLVRLAIYAHLRHVVLKVHMNLWVLWLVFKSLVWSGLLTILKTTGLQPVSETLTL